MNRTGSDLSKYKVLKKNATEAKAANSNFTAAGSVAAGSSATASPSVTRTPSIKKQNFLDPETGRPVVMLRKTAGRSRKSKTVEISPTSTQCTPGGHATTGIMAEGRRNLRPISERFKDDKPKIDLSKIPASTTETNSKYLNSPEIVVSEMSPPEHEQSVQFNSSFGKRLKEQAKEDDNKYMDKTPQESLTKMDEFLAPSLETTPKQPKRENLSVLSDLKFSQDRNKSILDRNERRAKKNFSTPETIEWDSTEKKPGTPPVLEKRLEKKEELVVENQAETSENSNSFSNDVLNSPRRRRSRRIGRQSFTTAINMSPRTNEIKDQDNIFKKQNSVDSKVLVTQPLDTVKPLVYTNSTSKSRSNSTSIESGQPRPFSMTNMLTYDTRRRASTAGGRAHRKSYTTDITISPENQSPNPFKNSSLASANDTGISSPVTDFSSNLSKYKSTPIKSNSTAQSYQSPTQQRFEEALNKISKISTEKSIKLENVRRNSKDLDLNSHATDYLSKIDSNLDSVAGISTRTRYNRSKSIEKSVIVNKMANKFEKQSSLDQNADRESPKPPLGRKSRKSSTTNLPLTAAESIEKSLPSTPVPQPRHKKSSISDSQNMFIIGREPKI